MILARHVKSVKTQNSFRISTTKPPEVSEWY